MMDGLEMKNRSILDNKQKQFIDIKIFQIHQCLTISIITPFTKIFIKIWKFDTKSYIDRIETAHHMFYVSHSKKSPKSELWAIIQHGPNENYQYYSDVM